MQWKINAVKNRGKRRNHYKARDERGSERLTDYFKGGKGESDSPYENENTCARARGRSLFSPSKQKKRSSRRRGGEFWYGKDLEHLRKEAERTKDDIWGRRGTASRVIQKKSRYLLQQGSTQGTIWVVNLTGGGSIAHRGGEVSARRARQTAKAVERSGTRTGRG